MPRRIALITAVAVAAAVIVPCASAQTLTHPNAPAKASPPPSKKNPRDSARGILRRLRGRILSEFRARMRA